MKSAVLYGVSLFVSNIPWYAAGCAPFLKELRIKKSSLAAIITACCLLNAAAGFAMAAWMPEWRSLRILHMLAQMLLLPFVYFAVFRVNPAKLVYTLLLIRAFSAVINFTAYLVDVPFFPPGTDIGIASTWEFTLTIAIENILVFPFVWRFFRGSLCNAFQILSTRGIWLLCVTPALFLALSDSFVAFVDRRTVWVHTTALTAITLIIGLAIIYTGLRGLLDNARHIRQESEIQTQLALQAQNYENLTQSIEAARAAHHDLRHHLNVIQEFVKQDNMAELSQYLDEYTASLPEENTSTWCENPAVNALLKHYLGQAQAAGAHLDIKLNLPARSGIPDTDLSIVFGNIFENAARSAAAFEGEALIRARCDICDAYIVLTVENSIASAVSHGQGLGLKNVMAVAKKYDGTARFEIRNGVYHSEVIFKKS